MAAPYTDPAWTPLFTQAAGIIVGTGSYLSHAGTLARELNVPCLVDLGEAFATLNDGDLVHLNATDGYVLPVSQSDTEEPQPSVQQ